MLNLEVGFVVNSGFVWNHRDFILLLLNSFAIRKTTVGYIIPSVPTKGSLSLVQENVQAQAVHPDIILNYRSATKFARGPACFVTGGDRLSN